MEGFGHAADDVEIGQAGLDHDHVGALGYVHGDLAQGLVAVRRIHLVGLLVALQRLDADGVAIGAVKGRGVFGGVGHDQCVLIALAFERRANGQDAAVHHVRRGDDIGAARDLDQGLFDQHLDRGVIDDASVVQQAVVTMVGIGIERDIDQQADIGHGRLDGPAGLRDQPVGIDGGAGIVGADALVKMRKQRQHLDAERMGFLGFLDSLADAQAVDALQRSDGFAGDVAVMDEDRPDQVGDMQAVLGDQIADPGRLPQPARPGEGEGRGGRQGHGGHLRQGVRQTAVRELSSNCKVHRGCENVGDTWPACTSNVRR